MDRSYRIKANVGTDQVLNVNLKQDIDLYEILSLKISQEKLYKTYSSDYGVIVGRVLANEAFGVPNVKVSVFIPLSDSDSLRNDIKNIYPYKSATDHNSDNIIYNTLPDYKKNDCHRPVGTFPKKEIVLDNDSILEVYDKYYKYTTVTNKAGDYMIFGVPTGQQVLHVDVDFSDIGILSQKPRDFLYKGYSMNMFDSPSQFKKSTNINSLAQIYTENSAVNVYPFWGDRSSNEVAITRKDINLQYKFETTCVFMGSVMTDTDTSSIGHTCIPDANIGEAGQLSPSEGTIEMIRKTFDDKVEEFVIRGNQLIDGDGVFCYQIPMNLDYVGMDEYGNIIPTNNPNKGIATRARVRFRFTLNENGDSNLTRHKARYLVPNNPTIRKNYVIPQVSDDVFKNDAYYIFGTKTPEECFRDLYWNKVYSVKSYVPRLQVSQYENNTNYFAIKGVNKKDAKKNTPIPYNKLNLNFSISGYYILSLLGRGSNNVSGFWRFLRHKNVKYSLDDVRESILEDLDSIGLDFYNDWLNGCLYFPLWFWHIRKKKNYKKGESAYENQFCECDKDFKLERPLYLYNNCSLSYEDVNLKMGNSFDYSSCLNMYTSINYGSHVFMSGVIKNIENKDGANVYYYSFGNKVKDEIVDSEDEQDEYGNPVHRDYYDYVRLFSTDIILLGSLDECDIDGIPFIGHGYPATTCNIPPIGVKKPHDTGIDPKDVREQQPGYEDEELDEVTYNGMNWGNRWNDDGSNTTSGIFKFKFGSGLFFGLRTHEVYHGNDLVLKVSFAVGGPILAGIVKLFGGGRHLDRIDIEGFSDRKTCINAERICELGVTMDSDVTIDYNKKPATDGKHVGRRDGLGTKVVSYMDGLITKRELEDIDARALFATLNFNPLVGEKVNETTGYKTYNLTYFYPTNFDGRLEDIAPDYTYGFTSDDRNRDYLDFRFGSINNVDMMKGSMVNAITVNRVRVLGVEFVIYKKDGKVVYVETTNNNFKAGDISLTNNPFREYVYNEDALGNVLDYSTKVRHFYMRKVVSRQSVNIMPDEMGYIFPLYENSFYFFFGLMPGSTAIDKFYNQFYSECPSEDSSPFNYKIETTAATACDKNAAKIKFTVEDIDQPYSIKLVLNSNTIREEENLYGLYTEFTGLTNGKYTYIITDAYGNSITDDVTILYQKIGLKTHVERKILTEFRGQPCCDICSKEDDYYGQLILDAYVLYEKEYKVTSISGSNGKYTLNGTNIKLVIQPTNGDEFFNYACPCEDGTCGKTIVPEHNGINQINIYRPSKYNIKIYEECPDGSTENMSFFNVNVEDERMLELYINDVPLKYMIGTEEDTPDKYNKNFYFYDPTQKPANQITTINQQQNYGWFGLHIPDTYADVFKTPMTEEHKLFWDEDLVDTGVMDILKAKFTFMFDLSNAAYVTSVDNNKYVFDLDGGEGEKLLRTAFPQYDKFKADSSDGASEFNEFMTYEKDSTECTPPNANIVSENYVYVDESTKFPKWGSVKPSLRGGGGLYDFNPKYNDRDNTAGNHVAGFSNNANLVSDDPCWQDETIKDYFKLPARAHDLYKCGAGLCTLSEENFVMPQVYTYQATDCKGDEDLRFFRTEFIDRRFDYDMIYFTPYDVPECIEGGVWSNGKVSGLTYNGIEMLYLDDVNKTIISDEGAVEYTYTKDDNESGGIITFNTDAPKRFYESKLIYNDKKYIDLREEYRYISRPVGLATCDESELVHVTCNPIPSPAFKNFGYYGGAVNGYPSKRWLTFYNVPYGDTYTHTTTSCGYNNINIQYSQTKMEAGAVPSETVTYTLETGDLVVPLVDDFEIMCQRGDWNVRYNDGGGEANTFKLKFKIVSKGTENFKSYINTREEIKLRLLKDDAGHSVMEAIKRWPCDFPELKNSVIIPNSSPINGFSEQFMESDTFKRTEMTVNESITGKKFLCILFDRLYYSIFADSLTKKLRTINMSTVYDVEDIGFSYTYKGTSDYDIDVETTGTVDIPDGSGSTYSEDTYQEGSGTSKHDIFEFKLTSKYLTCMLADACFRAKYNNGDDEQYKLGEASSVVTNGDTTTITLIMSKHRQLITECGSAELKVFLKIKNNLVYHFKTTIHG